MVTREVVLDVLGIAMEGNLACVQLLFIRGGRLLGGQLFRQY